MEEFPKIISVDDHVVEPLNLWQDRVPAAMKERAPKVVFAPKGDVSFVGGKLTVSMGEPGSGPDVAWWIYEDLKRPLMRLDASVGYDPAGGLAHAGGYVGDGVATTNLAGRTLRDLILGIDSDLTALPWVGHVSPRWEPEPLRWLGVNAGLRAMTVADAEESATGKGSLVAHAVAPLVGGH